MLSKTRETYCPNTPWRMPRTGSVVYSQAPWSAYQTQTQHGQAMSHTQLDTHISPAATLLPIAACHFFAYRHSTANATATPKLMCISHSLIRDLPSHSPATSTATSTPALLCGFYRVANSPVGAHLTGKIVSSRSLAEEEGQGGCRRWSLPLDHLMMNRIDLEE